MPDKVDIKCPRKDCRTQFEISLPKTEIVNQARFSIVMACHEQFVKCPKCGQALCFSMKNAETEWDLIPVPDAIRSKLEESSLITLPGLSG